MSIQSIFNKISTGKTKLSKARKVNLSLKDDLDRAAEALQDVFKDTDMYDIKYLVNNVTQALSDLDEAMGKYIQMDARLEEFSDAQEAFEDAASELGIDISEEYNDLINSVASSFDDAFADLADLEEAKGKISRIVDRWPYPFQ